MKGTVASAGTAGCGLVAVCALDVVLELGVAGCLVQDENGTINTRAETMRKDLREKRCGQRSMRGKPRGPSTPLREGAKLRSG